MAGPRVIGPLFRHDCKECVFLGRLEFSGELTYAEPDPTGGRVVRYLEAERPCVFDLYFCPKKGPGHTVIARYGDDGPDYMSGLYVADQVPALREAKKLAEEKGLL